MRKAEASFAITTIDRVGAVDIDRVVAGATLENVASRAAIDDVVTVTAVDGVVIRTAVQVVVTRTSQVQNKNNETASQFTGGFNNTGGSVRSNAVTLETHTHTGVVSGKSDTGNPNTGT